MHAGEIDYSIRADADCAGREKGVGDWLEAGGGQEVRSIPFPKIGMGIFNREHACTMCRHNFQVTQSIIVGLFA